MKKYLLLSLALFSILALSACTNPFAKKQSKVEAPKTLADTLSRQSEMKKFSNAAELKEYFAGRSNNAPVNTMARSEMAFGLGAKDSLSSATPAVGLGGGSGYSQTNVQVAGVDEADIVKTDGNYIYSLSGKKLVITQAVPAADAAVVSETQLPGNGQELFIDNGQLVVFGYEEIAYDGREMMIARPMSPRVFVAVYDISEPKSPKAMKNYKVDGSYISSRMIDSRIYFITNNYSFYPSEEALLPNVYDGDEKISGTSSNNRYAYPEVYYIDTPSAYSATTVAVLDLSNLDKPFESNVYFMPAGQAIYASRGALYLTYTKFISDYELRMTVARELMFSRIPDRERMRIAQIASIDSSILSDDEKAAKINQVIETYIARLPDNEQIQIAKELNDEFQKRFDALYKELETTVIHKIALNDGTLEYRGVGEVSGHVLNQFSMDEYDGQFRIATTRGQSWIMPFPIIAQRVVAPVQTNDSYNNVFVLDEDMKTVGNLENLAKGERIYSARFMGDRAYVVTFKQTDPLFVIDLSEPTAPKVAGELKIPGFSSYLHPYSDTILIGIGKEATDKGDQGVELGGLKLSLFDVADPAAPKEISSLVIGGKGSDSSVLYDHKALLFSADRELLVIPAGLTKPNSNNYQQEFQGALVFRIKADSIAERGRIGHNANDYITRSLYINDQLYTLSTSTLQINNLESLAVTKKITLPQQNIGGGDKPMPLTEPAAPVKE